jgi:tRNA(Ile)-lysidine synthase
MRPLLGTLKSRLRATLQARGIAWSEDPSNDEPAFERVRLRAARSALDALGLTPHMLALSARRLGRARAALDAVTGGYCAEPGGIVRSDACGVVNIGRERLRRIPEEIALRLVERCVLAAGGSAEPVPLGRLEPILASLRAPGDARPGSWTLARAIIGATLDTIQIEREPGRLPLPRLQVASGTNVRWDRRFLVSVSAAAKTSFEVRALGADGLRQLRELGRPAKSTRPLQLVPSFWQGHCLLAVPAIDFWAGEELKSQLRSEFLGVCYNSAGTNGSLIEDSEAF